MCSGKNSCLNARQIDIILATEDFYVMHIDDSPFQGYITVSFSHASTSSSVGTYELLTMNWAGEETFFSRKTQKIYYRYVVKTTDKFTKFTGQIMWMVHTFILYDENATSALWSSSPNLRTTVSPSANIKQTQIEEHLYKNS